ncbi:MAG: hypothetical protein QMD04_08765 [Anaerolineales bacterium]|nr:hypothetical protein [Anaerolineales bacterium]
MSLVVVVVAAAVPGFELDSEAGAGLAVVAASYIIGVAVDPGPGGWRGVIQSRKFYAAVVGFVVMFLQGFGLGLPFGLTEAQLVEIAIVFGAYIAGVSLEGKLQVTSRYG